MAIQFNADAALAKLGELVARHGPDAIDLASHVVQIDALNTLSGVIGYGAMAGVTFWAARFCLKRGRAVEDSFDADLLRVGLGFGVGISGLAWTCGRGSPFSVPSSRSPIRSSRG